MEGKDLTIAAEALTVEEQAFIHDITAIVKTAKEKTFRTANVMQVVSNWLVGRRIVLQEQGGSERAQYGKHVIEIASKALTEQFGKGYGETTLRNYRKFYLTFRDLSIKQPLLAEFGNSELQIQQPPLAESIPLSVELSWMHYERLMRVDDEKARMWYMRESITGQWSYRTLDRNISSQYYYRLLQTPPALQGEVIDEMHRLTADYQKDRYEYMKNPVVAEFLGFSRDTAFSETKLESAIIDHLQKFLMEFGKGYALVARQQHIRTDEDDYYIDLVFYNYILKCFLLVDLKTERITHQDIGQMDMYIRMYDELKCSEGDNPTMGLLLCAETSKDLARFSILRDSKQIFAAKYLTYLPTKEELTREIERQKEIFALQEGKQQE